ncbi:MAG: c-type cytochrome, partial [Acidobacteriota bacterium]
ETTDQQVKDLTDFLVSLNNAPEKQDAGTQNDQKKPETPTDQGSKPAAQAAPSGTVSAGGQQYYDANGCAKCHAIGGKGGTSAPSLSDVGKRLPKDKLTAVIQAMRTGKSSMPPLPKGTTDQQVKDLTDFLASLNGSPEKQDAGTQNVQKTPETPTDQGSKPAAQAAPSGTVSAGGQQYYDANGCAKCHAIGGKGGTSAPSLSDVGKRLPKDKLTAVIQAMRTGKSSMPPLPKGTTDQQVKDLTDFLASLNGSPQKQDAGTQKVPEQPTDQPSRNSQSPPAEDLARLLASDTNGPTALPGILLLSLIAVIAALIGVLVFRPGLTATAGGKILAFFVLFLMPLIAAGIGTTYHIDRSKSTKFCVSCHEMEPFGKSLMVNDDSTHLPAAHFQNHRVPVEVACYTCHTNYAMFGSFRAKIGGLKHIYVHYLGKPPAPEAMRLYEPFNNRECLHCHLGARSFEEGKTHNSDPYLLAAVKGNQVSCLSCHRTVHDIAGLNQAKFWKGTF